MPGAIFISLNAMAESSGRGSAVIIIIQARHLSKRVIIIIILLLSCSASKRIAKKQWRAALD